MYSFRRRHLNGKLQFCVEKSSCWRDLLLVVEIFCITQIGHPPPILYCKGCTFIPSHAGQHELIGIYEVQNNYRYAWYSPLTSCSFAYHVGEVRHPGWAPLRYTHVQIWIINEKLWQVITLMIQVSHVYYAKKTTCRSWTKDTKNNWKELNGVQKPFCWSRLDWNRWILDSLMHKIPKS